jgi:hypothetical protein
MTTEQKQRANETRLKNQERRAARTEQQRQFADILLDLLKSETIPEKDKTRLCELFADVKYY